MIQPFIENRAYTAFYCPMDHKHYDRRGSNAYFCPYCGEVWARFVDTDYPRWHALHVGCRKCGPRHPTFDIPGSILLSWDHDLYRALPADILQREVLLLAAHVKQFPDFRP